MNAKGIIGFLWVGLLACSCSALKQHAREYSIPAQEPDIHGKIDLTGFNLFVREVEKVEKEKVSEAGINHENKVSQYQQMAYGEAAPGAVKTLISIEYIFLNLDSGKFVYITTVPDLRQTYYQAMRQKRPDKGILNVFDFNTIHAGKIASVNGTPVVQLNDVDSLTTYSWEFSNDSDTFAILRLMEFKSGYYVEERSVVNSVRGGAKFKYVGDFKIIFESNKVQETPVALPVIFFKEVDGKFCAHFRFTDPIQKVQEDVRTRLKKENKHMSVLFEGTKHVPVNPSVIWKKVK